MSSDYLNRKLYIHETTKLRSGSTPRFEAAFADHYQPAMERAGARLFGLWEAAPFNSNWPEITTIWEVDNWQHFAKIGAARHRDPAERKAFEQWDGLLGELDAHGEGRLTYPNRSIKSLADMQASGFKTTVMIQEIMQTKPGKQDAYVEQLEYAYVPWSERTGKKWFGSFTTVFRYNEVIHYWALDGGWDGFGEHYPSFRETIPADLKSWMAMAPSLRDGWDDSFLQSLSANPLG